MTKIISNTIKDRIYAEWILTGDKYSSIAPKYNVSPEFVGSVISRKLKGKAHKEKVKEIRKMRSEAKSEYYTNGEVKKEMEIIPCFETVPIYKTVGAWGNYEKEQYRILKYIKK